MIARIAGPRAGAPFVTYYGVVDRANGMIPSTAGYPPSFPFLYDDRKEGLELSHRLVVNDTNAYLAAGLASLGVIQAPTYSVRDAIVGGKLVPLLVDWRQPIIPVHVIYAPNRYLSAKVRVFIDWLVELFERDEHLRRR